MDRLSSLDQIKELVGQKGVSKEALLALLEEAQRDHRSAIQKMDREMERSMFTLSEQISDLEAEVFNSQNLYEEQLIEEFKKRIEAYRNGKVHVNDILTNFKIILDDNK